ncbi:GDSL-type esterase/lipase family protein [Actinoallomurus rhizosphaericola]|uniref:GDSL-type esterase/lipase family protein n=1 Tax=Actinoallomurus rhizosphaericola TaxID=2952536 RepID=UPI00209180B8|nr:GDSL-type esterase/lipase family protein [Actinoallomurus rhizosphaericola]MCO5993507.1 GDSL-type esterase/lipase family protein [Actinoallomurus rhizosphaericola]
MPPADVPLLDGPVEIRGALDLERTAAGLRPRRLPSWTRPQIPSPFCELVVAMPSGVRMVFATEATGLELDVLTTKTLAFTGEPNPGGVFALVVDGVPAERVPTPDGNVLALDPSGVKPPDVTPGEPATVRFGPLPPGRKQVEIWLPQSAQVELIALRADGPVHPPEPDPRPRWVHHGSSISHCMEADDPLGTWPVVAARAADVNVLNLGLAGNAMLDPFTARTIRDLPADVISLKLGINVVNGDTMRLRVFEPAVHGFLDTVREGHPDTPLLVVSPILCPMVEDLPGPTFPEIEDGTVRFRTAGDAARLAEGALSLSVIREVLHRIVGERSAADPNLHYLDGRELFGESDVADLPDALHPNAAGYRRMGERFAAYAFGAGGPFAR